ncbi:hypothetical protein GCM10027586_03790 [Kineococcus gypseus]
MSCTCGHSDRAHTAGTGPCYAVTRDLDDQPRLCTCPRVSTPCACPTCTRPALASRA